MTKRIELEDHKRIADDINELIEGLVHLIVDVSNSGGKTKMRGICDRISKIKNELSSVRWDLENMMLADFPNAPLYTQYREYRKEDTQDSATKEVIE